MNKPAQLNEIELTELREVCQEYIDGIENGKLSEINSFGDLEHLIYETALEAIFGKDIWHWLNLKIE